MRIEQSERGWPAHPRLRIAQRRACRHSRPGCAGAGHACTGEPDHARAASGGVRPRARPDPRQLHRSPPCAAAFSTISTATPAKAIRCSSAKYRSSTAAKARYRPAICARRPGRAATPKSFSSARKISSTKLVDTVDGHAEHGTGATAVSLVKPKERALDLDAGVVFPTQQMVRVIEAARAEKTILDFPVYDGSDNGDKVYNTLTVIGRELAPAERKHADAASDEPKLAAVARWPVTVSYFDKSKKTKSGEETPVYAINFELYENGISRTLSLDYNEFVVTGKLTSLEIKAPKPCP